MIFLAIILPPPPLGTYVLIALVAFSAYWAFVYNMASIRELGKSSKKILEIRREDVTSLDIKKAKRFNVELLIRTGDGQEKVMTILRTRKRLDKISACFGEQRN